MERSRQEIKEFTLQIIKADDYFDDGTDVKELYDAVSEDEELNQYYKNLLEEILSDAAKMEASEVINAPNVLSAIDSLSIFADAWGMYVVN